LLHTFLVDLARTKKHQRLLKTSSKFSFIKDSSAMESFYGSFSSFDDEQNKESKAMF
jgi:hypothetical protein